MHTAHVYRILAEERCLLSAQLLHARANSLSAQAKEEQTKKKLNPKVYEEKQKETSYLMWRTHSDHFAGLQSIVAIFALEYIRRSGNIQNPNHSFGQHFLCQNRSEKKNFLKYRKQ